MAITRYYVTSDAMGSVTGVLDAEGTVLERRCYNAFGSLACSTKDFEPATNSLTDVDICFQGQIADDSTGLYQMGFRWYNAEIGRWLSADPLGLRGGINLQSFTCNMPTERSDWNGLAPEKNNQDFNDTLKENYPKRLSQIPADTLGEVQSRQLPSIEIKVVESTNYLMVCYEVKITGVMKQYVFIRKTLSASEAQKTKLHEAVHFNSNKRIWNEMVDKLSVLESKKCCECRIGLKHSNIKKDLTNFASLIIKAADLQADVDAYEFDQKEYGRPNNDRDLQSAYDRALRNAAETTAALAEATRAYEKLGCK
jgi:RHS repeat-associated protein